MLNESFKYVFYTGILLLKSLGNMRSIFQLRRL